jgi:hypothetical protein
MTKKPHTNPTVRPSGWSIRSNGLSSGGQATVLKQLDVIMSNDYAHVVCEPPPNHLRVLLDKIDQHSNRPNNRIVRRLHPPERAYGSRVAPRFTLMRRPFLHLMPMTVAI